MTRGDYDFAKKYGIPVRPVLARKRELEAEEENPVFDGLGWMVNSDRESFDGLFGDEAKKAVISTLEEEALAMEQFNTGSETGF